VPSCPAHWRYALIALAGLNCDHPFTAADFAGLWSGSGVPYADVTLQATPIGDSLGISLSFTVTSTSNDCTVALDTLAVAGDSVHLSADAFLANPPPFACSTPGYETIRVTGRRLAAVLAPTLLLHISLNFPVGCISTVCNPPVDADIVLHRR